MLAGWLGELLIRLFFGFHACWFVILFVFVVVCLLLGPYSLSRIAILGRQSFSRIQFAWISPKSVDNWLLVTASPFSRHLLYQRLSVD